MNANCHVLPTKSITHVPNNQKIKTNEKKTPLEHTTNERIEHRSNWKTTTTTTKTKHTTRPQAPQDRMGHFHVLRQGSKANNQAVQKHANKSGLLYKTIKNVLNITHTQINTTVAASIESNA
jgi:hypothetical protein